MGGQEQDNEGPEQRARGQLQTMGISRAASGENQNEIFMIPRQKSRSRDRRESRMFLVDGQLCWSDEPQVSLGAGYSGRRSSSVGLMFGSSMDLSGINQSIDSSGGAGSGSEEAISYRIKWCRENILQLKRQTWPMEKKLQVLKASKLFIKQHQGELKQSKQAKDVIAGTSAIFERYWRHFKREFANFLVIITPWEMRIKKIESHFGSVVASYFTFLRWIFWLNLANSLVMCSFVMVPELIENVPDPTGMRKGELGMQQPIGDDGRPMPPPEFNPTLGEMWEFEGFLKFSPIFYGYYSNVEISRSGFWRNPLAFLMSAMMTYLFCFFCISRKLSQNTKMSRIGSKDDEYTFCWTVFVGWDFMIGNSETAYNKTSSLVMNLKEGILEEKEQTKDRDWRLIIRRVFANVLTLMLIIASAYVVTLAVQRSENLPEDASLLQKNELQLVMSGIQFMFPPLFDVIGIIEKYHPRKALSWQLGRILFLDFLNFYTLMFSLFGTVDQMGLQLNEMSGNITQLRKNATYYRSLFTTTTTTTTTSTTTTSTTATYAPETITESLTENVTQFQNNQTSQTPLNASTMLTTILLASSTISPTTMNGSSTINLTSSTMLPSSTMTGLPSTAATITSIDLTSMLITTPTTERLATSNPPSTTEFASPTPPTAATKPPTVVASKSEDEDYIDLGEVLKTTAPTLRRKRRDAPRRQSIGVLRTRQRLKTSIERQTTSTTEETSEEDEVERFGDIEREYDSSEELTRRSSQPPSAQQAAAQFNRIGAFLPPIRDPYRKADRGRQPQQPAPAIIFPTRYEEDEEEPLEGRLMPSTTRISYTSTTRRPAIQRQPGGVARPIGGSTRQRGGRVQLTSTGAPLPGLDDDTNEDVGGDNGPDVMQPKPGGQVGSTNFIESTTGRATEGITLGPDYSLVPAAESTSQGFQAVADTTMALNEPVEPPNGTAGGAASETQGKSALAPSPVLPDGTAISDTDQTKPMDAIASADQVTEYPSTRTSCTPREDNDLLLLGLDNRTGVSKLKSSPGFNASEVNYADCVDIPEFKHQEILALNATLQDKLKTLCWETMFGQEMVKIVVMDLVMTVVSAVSFEFMRACFVRYCNRFFFWDLERGFPGYQDFKLAENVLHLVNNQSTVWMGMFFAPGLPAINTVKLAVLMYVRSWAVLTCNIPHETVFKVSKSNNFYYWILLINLLICILPVAYAVTWIRPSWHCGPFGGECRMYIVVTKLVKSLLPPEANSVFRYLTSPGAVIPILIALILIIYYLASTVSSSKEANKELKAQLKKDKEQEAAVPEITNTTVADTASPAQASTSGPAAGATAFPAPIPNELAPLTAANSTLAASLTTQVKAGLMAPMAKQVSDTVAAKSKSLLMPPAP